MAKKSTSTKQKKKNTIRRINRKLSEYEKLGFDDAQIYSDYIMALSRTKGINLVRRADGTYYVSQSEAKASLAKLEKLDTFKSVAQFAKEKGGYDNLRKSIDVENFITEYRNEIGYDIGVEAFDDFGKDLKNGLKNKYTLDELYDLTNALKEQLENIPQVNPFA